MASERVIYHAILYHYGMIIPFKIPSSIRSKNRFGIKAVSNRDNFTSNLFLDLLGYCFTARPACRIRDWKTVLSSGVAWRPIIVTDCSRGCRVSASGE